MGFPFRNDKDLKSTFSEIDTNGKGRISELEFVEWWNKVSSQQSAVSSVLQADPVRRTTHNLLPTTYYLLLYLLY